MISVSRPQYSTFIFWIIIFLGFGLRFLTLNQHDFWFDEAFTYYIAKLPIQKILAVVSSDDNPPLYYLLIHLLVGFNKSEIVLRLPSFVAGIATIFATYAMTKDFINKKVALLSATLVSLSPLTIYLSTEARPHSLAVLITILEVYVFLTLLKKPTFNNRLLFVGLTTIGFYTHYYIFLLLIPFTILVISTNRLFLKKWLLILAICLITVIPWLFITISAKQNECWCPNTILSLPSTLISPVTSGVGIVTLRSYPKLPAIELLALVFLSLISVLFFLKGLFENRVFTFLFLLPLLLLSVAGFFFNIFSPKAFSIFSPLYFCILAIGLLSSAKKKYTIPTIILLLGISSIIQSNQDFFKGDRSKSVFEIVKTENAPIAHTSVTTYYSVRYYMEEDNLDESQNFLITKNPLSQLTQTYVGGNKNDAIPNTTSLWIVNNDRWEGQKEEHREAIGKLLSKYFIDRTYKLDNIFVIHLKRKGSLG